MSNASAIEKKPKVFVSYSWTNQEHVDRVLSWCEQLVSNGIDVEIDRWSLNEGDDKYAFMERMVSDATITHVLIFTDARYAQKANERAHGVGTESQIISAEVYGRTTQEKFLPVVCEFDDKGEPCVPVFLKGRIYFNFSTPEAANENWEKLIRRIYNKPALTKPRLGKAPGYLDAGNAPPRLTTSKFLALKDALQKSRPNAQIWITDYIDAVVLQLQEHQITESGKTVQDTAEKINTALEALLPLRNELVELFSFVLSSLKPNDAIDTIGDLLEVLLRFKFPQADQSNSGWQLEHYGFLAYEVFLYAVATHVRLRLHDGLAALLNRRYIVPGNDRRSRSGNFTIFRFYSKTLAIINEQSSQRRLSMEADLVHRRATLAAYPMMMLMQSDLLCCLRVVTHPQEYEMWPPLTTVYAEYLGALDIFQRAEDRRTFRQIALVIGIENKVDLEAKLATWEEQHNDQLSWLFRYGDLSLEGLIGLDNLDTAGV